MSSNNDRKIQSKAANGGTEAGKTGKPSKFPACYFSVASRQLAVCKEFKAKSFMNAFGISRAPDAHGSASKICTR